MNIKKPAVLLALCVILGISFHNFTIPEEEPDEVCHYLPTEVYSDIYRNGKVKTPEKKDDIFTPTPLEELGFPVIGDKLRIALQHQLRVLDSGKFKDGQKAGNLRLTYSQLREVIGLLLERAGTQPAGLPQYLEAYQTWGGDKRGNVYFTGYFTPEIKVKKQADEKYKYPIYSYPSKWEGRLPSRQEIDSEHALAGMGLELAYASNPLDIYIMQLQGSGHVQFLDTGEHFLFKYAGENRHRYKNIQRFFTSRDDISIGNISLDGMRRYLNKHPEMMDSVLFFNPSYTFFEPRKELVKGAADVPLMPGISIAADSRHFPLGSVVLAAFPVTEHGKVTHHEYRLLLPQDVGGAIRGPGHVDVYCGSGDMGRARASAIHHYGQMWVLLPKKNEQVAMNDL
ncbi:MAG: MltA domain-containing protein [Saprospiraceae bacterium]